MPNRSCRLEPFTAARSLRASRTGLAAPSVTDLAMFRLARLHGPTRGSETGGALAARASSSPAACWKLRRMIKDGDQRPRKPAAGL